MNKTPDEEMEQIRRGQEIEKNWWQKYPEMETVTDIDRAVEDGWAERVFDAEGYKISTKVDQNRRVLEKNTHAMLKEIAAEWQKSYKNIDKNTELFLVISSLARTTTFQKELIKEGYPAVEKSTHVKLGAFDIATEWFAKNNPEALSILEKILNRFAQEGKINFIPESTIGAYHVASNPAFFSS